MLRVKMNLMIWRDRWAKFIELFGPRSVLSNNVTLYLRMGYPGWPKLFWTHPYKNPYIFRRNPYNPYNFRKTIHTIRTIFFLKNPYNPYIFLNQSVHFFKNPYIFFKNLYNQYNFRKKSHFWKKNIKIQFFIHCPLCSVHVRGFKLLQQESICKKLASYIYTN